MGIPVSEEQAIRALVSSSLDTSMLSSNAKAGFSTCSESFYFFWPVFSLKSCEAKLAGNGMDLPSVAFFQLAVRGLSKTHCFLYI